MVTSNDTMFVLVKLPSKDSVLWDNRWSDVVADEISPPVAADEEVTVVSSFFMFATRTACRCTSARYSGAIRGEGGEQRPGIPPTKEEKICVCES